MAVQDALNRFFCEYRSVRKVRVPNPILASIYWGLLFIMALYVSIYTVWISKGYQTFDTVVGGTSTKVKGTASIGNYEITDWNNLNDTIIYDAIDLIVPSVEADALFVTTGIVETSGQTRGICNGNSDVDSCNNDTDCVSNTYSSDSQGIYTGVCGSNNRCQVYSWCPLEDDSEINTLNNIGNFTIFVRIDIHFPEFNVERTNTKIRNGKDYPEYGYNLFTLDDLVMDATGNEYTTADLASSGAVLLFESDWDCDLDDSEADCSPSYTVSRLDNQTDTITTGFNFRTAYYEDDTMTRTLKKLYGIRIIFFTSGVAGEFNFAALSLTLGAGLFWIGVASLITDIVLEHFLPESVVYGRAKSALLKQEIVQTKLQTHKSDNEHHKSIDLKGAVDGDEVADDVFSDDLPGSAGKTS